RPLEEHLGDAKKYLNKALGSDGPQTEVIGIHEYEYRGNWKLHLENTVDGYHPRYLHRLIAQSGIWSTGQSVDLGGGHGVVEWQTASTKGSATRHTGLDPSEHTPDTSRAMALFPNAILVHIQDLINLRLVIPIAPDRTLIYAIGLGIKGEDARMKQRRAVQLS